MKKPRLGPRGSQPDSLDTSFVRELFLPIAEWHDWRHVDFFHKLAALAGDLKGVQRVLGRTINTARKSMRECDRALSIPATCRSPKRRGARSLAFHPTGH